MEGLQRGKSTSLVVGEGCAEKSKYSDSWNLVGKCILDAVKQKLFVERQETYEWISDRSVPAHLDVSGFATAINLHGQRMLPMDVSNQRVVKAGQGSRDSPDRIRE
jgi:hypothetical protein